MLYVITSYNILTCHLVVPSYSIFPVLRAVASPYCKIQGPSAPVTAAVFQHQHALFQAFLERQHDWKYLGGSARRHRSQQQGIQNVDLYCLASPLVFQGGFVLDNNIYQKLLIS